MTISESRGSMLFEALIVVVLVGVVIVLSLGAFRNVTASVRTSGCISDLRQVHAAFMAYAADHRGRLPLPVDLSRPPDEIIWERSLADPRVKGVYLPASAIKAGDPKRLLFNREIAAMGGDPRGNHPSMTRSYYHMNHEFNLSYTSVSPQDPDSMHRLSSFEHPGKTMLLISGWAPRYRTPDKQSNRGDMDGAGSPAFIHNRNHALVLYVGGNTQLLKKEEIPIAPATVAWREFWLPSTRGSDWR